MMAPLRTAMTVGSVDDTSLAVPSDDNLRSGQQRVLTQVHTIKRCKSKQGKSGQLSPSPTTTSPQTVLSPEFGSFKFSPSNGTFSRTNSSMSTGFSKMRVKGQSQQTLRTRQNRHSTYSMNNGTQITSSQSRITQLPFALSRTEGKMGTMKISKKVQESVVDSGIKVSDMTLKKAVEFLSHPDENYQQYGATFIHHTTYNEESAKLQVRELGGIPGLVSLLRSPNTEVSQGAAGALRNLVFMDRENKLEVQNCGGIGKALQLLKETDSTDTQKQIAGLLWNLSSDDKLKEELIATALPALTENVVVPYTCWSDNSANNNIHPDVFHSATGCLRNLSCASKKERQAMRDCRGLIDSLLSYVQSCVAEENPDDQSVENCACILHNLTYQLEEESPQCFSKFQSLVDSEFDRRRSPTIGCFSPKSGKAQREFSFDKMPDDIIPSGAKRLCHPSTMQTYLSLMGSSKKDSTLEACCGALQNLTASSGLGSSAMSQILVQKLGALLHMSPLLKSSNRSLQKTALSLLGNMYRTSGSQTSVSKEMAKQILPELTSILSSGPREMGNSDDSIATACSTVLSLMMTDTEVTKKVISSELVSSVADLSENTSFPKARNVASALLYNMWNDKNLQCVVKKLGMGKSLFVNDNTTAAFRSLQVIE
ncbi:plakophilin-1 isoform X2 [Plectropomus leopardus]|uniref:plakophilin-1 isoform X2 n=1 Tax=Plectropomus leopardus TaxID=160734 RepID=UPI001C4AD02F|nr:plakophilin-1 isoform X2 [Plectropomus leopardus]